VIGARSVAGSIGVDLGALPLYFLPRRPASGILTDSDFPIDGYDRAVAAIHPLCDLFHGHFR
jgi:hypothetical protein